MFVSAVENIRYVEFNRACPVLSIVKPNEPNVCDLRSVLIEIDGTEANRRVSIEAVLHCTVVRMRPD